MGTRIHVFLSHDLPQFDDTAATLTRLQAALPATLAVRDYWRLVDPDYPPIDRWTRPRWKRRKTEIMTWEARPISPTEVDRLRRYDAPGSLFLIVTPAAALIFTGGRWRGFLMIEPLRKVHLAAFRALARALHSDRLAICHDRDDLTDAFQANGTLEASVARLRAEFGPPQPSVDDVAAAVAAKAERTVPDVWYLDVLGQND